MTKVITIRDSNGPANLLCPECPQLVATVEGATAPWCARCRQWLGSAACAKRHRCRQRRPARTREESP